MVGFSGSIVVDCNQPNAEAHKWNLPRRPGLGLLRSFVRGLGDRKLEAHWRTHSVRWQNTDFHRAKRRRPVSCPGRRPMGALVVAIVSCADLVRRDRVSGADP